MRILALVSTIFLTGCIQQGGAPPAAATGEGEIPFELAGAGGAAIVVPVRINDTGPYRFVLDTGATMTCLDQSLAERLELPKPVGVVGFGATVGQRSGSMTLHRVDTLEVGNARASGLNTCALDLQNVKDVGLNVEGLLGLNFLRSFTVTLDFERKVLSLTRS